MRLRRASPLLLLLAPSLVSANAPERRLYKRDISDALLSTQEHAAALERRAPELREVVRQPVPEADAIAKNKDPQRPYKGTEDAPVDGEDGKPKIGPFVDYAAEKTRTKKNGAEATELAKAKPTSLDRFKDAGADETWNVEDIPEKNDGVMNDENRVAPKKGTDGTAGGISEKEKERKALGAEGKKPQQPKEAPELPHSEEERIEEEQKQKAQKLAVEGEGVGKEKPEFGEGGIGLEKPTDLPDKPHTQPYKDSQGSKSNGEPPVGSNGDASWLTDTMPYTEGQTNKKTVPTKPDPLTGLPIPAGSAAADDESWHEWFHSFVLSFTMIIFSEIGDKTFLVAALMAMRHPKLLVFSAALGALIVMTILSAVLGHAVPTLLPKRFTTFAAAVLFLVFGARMLREGMAMPKDLGVGEEMKEVEAELEEKEHSMARSRRRSSAMTPYSLESGRGRKSSSLPQSEPSPPSSRSPSPRTKGDRLAGLINLVSLVLSPAWVQTFVMTFLGEWGDRSQIATIAMAAGQDYWLVTLGAIAGHACCTGLAVVGGAALAGKVSLRIGESHVISFPAARTLVLTILHSHYRRRPRLPGLRRHLPHRVSGRRLDVLRQMATARSARPHTRRHRTCSILNHHQDPHDAGTTGAMRAI